MRPQPWCRAMTDERPVRNEMACPKDFNSAVTDKTHAPFALTTRVRDREDSPKVRAGGSPFGFVEGNSERHDAGNRWVSIYTKLAAVLASCYLTLQGRRDNEIAQAVQTFSHLLNYFGTSHRNLLQ
jgi:hypothetical protein